MTRSTIAVLTTVCVVVAMVGGCASMQKGPSDEELVAGVLAGWKAAFDAQDVERIMAAFSEDFLDNEGLGKEPFREMVEAAISQGFFDGVQLAIDGAITMIEGDTANVAQVEFVGGEDIPVLSLVLKKEDDGVWRIVSAD